MKRYAVRLGEEYIRHSQNKRWTDNRDGYLLTRNQESAKLYTVKSDAEKAAERIGGEVVGVQVTFDE